MHQRKPDPTPVAHQTLEQAFAQDLVNLLVFETDRTLASSNNLINSNVAGLNVQSVGLGDAFDGFGSKYTAVLPVLRQLEPSALTVISDGRDVLLNHKVGGESDSITALESFVSNFGAITGDRQHAVIVSAEAQCCVSALTYAAPGDYFALDGSRDSRACFSGKNGCMWNGDDKALPWEDFMKELAQTNGAEERDDIYLNAGLMVGRAADLINVITKADIGSQEDDQAVLTDYMYLHPDELVLDYNQALFGNNRDTCMFDLEGEQLIHKQTKTTPLFVHTPGGKVACHESLMEQLGQKGMTKTVRRRLSEWSSRTLNYKQCPEHQKLVSGYCVMEWCHADYKCPANSHRRPNRQCYNNCNDCECNDGYVMNSKGQCEQKCPEHQKFVSGYCVMDWCHDDFKCPSNSHRLPNRQCYNNAHDCACNDGYVMNAHGQCEKKCPEHQKLVAGYCVMDWCTADYQCPRNSHRIPGRQCYNNCDDCQCNSGYYMHWKGYCARNYWNY